MDKDEAIQGAVNRLLQQAQENYKPVSTAKQIEQMVRRERERLHEEQTARDARVANMFWQCEYCQTVHKPRPVVDLETGQPYDFNGRIVYVPVSECPCDGYQAAKRQRDNDAAEKCAANKIAWLEREAEWQSHDTEWPQSAEHKARLRMTKQRVYDWYMQETKGLMLAGDYGCGKSRLLKIVTRAYGNQGIRAIFITEPDIVAKIKARALDEWFVSDCKLAKVLVIDDIGREQFDQYSGWIKNSMQSFYFTILEKRANADVYTLFSTNRQVSDLAEYIGGAAFDRLMHIVGSQDNVVNLFGVPSYRRRGWSK